jgi:hypothetical protein
MTLFKKYNWTELAQELDNLNDQIKSMAEELKDLNVTLEKMPQTDELMRTAERLPGVDEVVEHPIEKGYYEKMFTIILDLNDHYRWSRERIADWVETLNVDTTFKTVYTKTEQEEETQ